jgi:hypothetical protein
MHYHDDTSTSLISYAFLIGIIVWGIIHFRKENNGYFTLSNALKTGLGIALISSITVIYIINLINFIDPEFIDKSMEF